jgi:predicted alpha-1,2-mannosidase
MFKRRDVLALPAIAAVPIAAAAAPPIRRDADPLATVDPFIGTGGHGHTYPGATVPFGAVQLGPDTNVAGWDASSGYHYDDPTIMGFSHTHLSGTGCGDMLDLLVVPRSGPVPLDPGRAQRPVAGYHSRFDRLPAALSRGQGLTAERGYRSRFDHASERAEPGYYRVMLDDAGVDAELTATARAGLHRYRFVAGAAAHLLIDWAHGARDADRDPDYGPTRITEAWLELRDDGVLVGGRRVHQWADGRLIHFAMRFSAPPLSRTFFSNDRAVPADQARIDGEQLKCMLAFGQIDGPLLVKVGLSGVDVAGALRNLDADIPGWDFDAVRSAANADWNAELGRIAIVGGDARQRRIFTTALYHCCLAPTVFSDIDRRYRGMDSVIHTLTPGEDNFSTYSLWDTYRAIGPLFSLIQPERAPQMVRNLIRMAEESPYGPPIWPLQGAETFTMNAWHGVVMIAEAATKGLLSGAQCRRAWAALRHRAFDDRALDMGLYRARGYLPCDKVQESVSKTLEIAYDDWALACIAQAAGARDDAAVLRARSLNYTNLYDPETGFMRPRYSDGSWSAPFDPREVGHLPGKKDYTESDAWQATFVPQHALERTIALNGGPRAFEAKLDALFAATPAMSVDADPDIAGMVGQYAHGNEPCQHIAWLYTFVGAPHKTQAMVRHLLQTQYDAAPDGLPGNEDCGQMSAWYVMAALGLYAVDPVSGVYILHGPLFDKATLALPGGRRLTVVAHGNAPDRPYVRGLRWNGAALGRLWIDHATLITGGVLEFEMSAQPDGVLGVAADTWPPSRIDP